MKNTRLMSRLFSATNEKDEQLVNQVAADIEDAKTNGAVDTDELEFKHVGDGRVAITDKENGEVTMAERAEDGNYDLYPSELPTEELEGYVHPEGDGVTPSDVEGEPMEDVEEDHLGGNEIAEAIPEPVAEEVAAEGPVAEDVCPECGKNPCECGEPSEDEREFSVSTDNAAVLRIFSDQEFMERIFSEVIESEETAKVGDIKVEKLPDEDNAVVVTSESTGDQAKVVLDDENLEVTELDSKNFADYGQEYVEGSEFEPLHVVGVNVNGHELIDAPEYCPESAEELAQRLAEQGVDGVQIFEDPDAARDYAIDLLDSLGARSEEDVEEPEEMTFSDHTIYVTRFYSENTVLMDRLFSECCNDVDASQKEIEDALESGEESETEDAIITPVNDTTAVVEDKENGEFTKVTVTDDTMEAEPISKEEAEEMKEFSHIWCDSSETRFFSDTEELTDYMTRLFSGDADEADIEKAIENGEQVETDSEVITPVDAETAVIEDKENGEFSKATLSDEDIDIVPISESEADNLTKDLLVEDKDEKENGESTKATNDENIEVVPISESEADNLTEDLLVEKDSEENKDEEKENKNEEKKEDEKEFSANDPLAKFFAQAGIAAAPAAAPVAVAAPAVAPEAVPAQEVAPAEEPAPSVEAIEDKAVAAVQSIQAAAAEAEAAILNAKSATVENAEPELQEAQFSEKTFSDNTLVSWLNGNKLKK